MVGNFSAGAATASSSGVPHFQQRFTLPSSSVPHFGQGIDIAGDP
jgi:hypothetical protein